MTFKKKEIVILNKIDLLDEATIKKGIELAKKEEEARLKREAEEASPRELRAGFGDHH